MWTNEERLKSSTWRELKAVVLTLKGFSDHFQNKFVKLFTDNQNVARIYEVGSMKKDQHELAPEIFLFLHKKVNLFKNRMDP
jgi:thiosulfate reductase cytochrome b subunit